MKRYCKMPLFVLLVLAAVLFAVGFSASPAWAVQDEEAVEDPGYTEEEYAAWEAASKEPDPVKSGAMLMEFIKKNPESKMTPYAEGSYQALLSKCLTEKKYQELETLAEQWDAYKPGNRDTIVMIATAAGELNQTEKYLQNLERLYQLEPKVEHAKLIASAYKKNKNDAKYIEWSEIVLKAPEENSNFFLRYELMRHYAAKEDTAKMLQYAQETLKAVDQVKDPSTDVAKILPDVRYEANDNIGRARFIGKKYNEAIAAFLKALKIKKSAEGYYLIGQCLDLQGKPDNAILAYAKAQKLGETGDAAAKAIATKAKDRLETIYKATHNGNTVGIDKRYRRAQETADENLTAPIQ